MRHHAKALVAALTLLVIVGVAQAIADTAPTPTMEPVSTFSYTSAHLEGEVDPNGGPSTTTWQFQFSSEGPEGPWAPGPEGHFEGIEAEENTGLPVEGDLSGLKPNTTYYTRLVATNEGGQSSVSVPSFTTLEVQAPSVTIEAVSSVTSSSAQFVGHINPNAPEAAPTSAEVEAGFRVSWHFQCSPACPGAEGQLEADNAEHEVTAEATGLKPGTKYNVSLVAENAGTNASAGPESFTTEANAPSVSAISASEVGPVSAKLNATINPGGAATSYRFEYTDEADFEATGFENAAKVPVPDASIGSGTSDVAVNQPISGLDPSTRYHYRVLATNSVDSAESAKAFKTFAAPKAPEGGQFPGQGFLPDHRAWEMVSPPDKHGVNVVHSPYVIQAAAEETPGLPMAASFMALGGFGDVESVGLASRYLSERTGAPGTSGWSTHGVVPALESVSVQTLDLIGRYEGDLSADLTKGMFMTLSPLTAAPNVKGLRNYYTRTDLRSAGPGNYLLDTDCALCSSPLPPLNLGNKVANSPGLAGTSEDFTHVLIESRLNLTPDASGNNVKLYKSDDGAVRLISTFGTCPGGSSEAAPCSGTGAFDTADQAKQIAPRALSADGSRAVFMDPIGPEAGQVNTAPGRTTRLFQLDDQGTTNTADDAIVELNASEKASPEIAKAAAYGIASSDGDRVFFTSQEQLTETPGKGLYMWDRKETNETQQVEVDASGGSFRLTGRTQPSYGTGTLSSGSAVITAVEGSFIVGQAIEGSGIPAGTTITEFHPESEEIVLSQQATASASGVALEASTQATTPSLAFNTSAAQVQGALEALPTVGQGNVSVTGGPGGPGGTTPYAVTFEGALAGVNVLQMHSDPSGLSGGAASAAVSTTAPVENLSLIGNSGAPRVIGTSEDGHRLYFWANEQLVAGGPPPTGNGDESGPGALFYWQDAGGPAGGTLSFVGGVSKADIESATLPRQWSLDGSMTTAWVTPDGRHLAFEASRGDGLAPGYESGACGLSATPNNIGKCSELYVYSAEGSTPLEPDVRCASCSPSGEPVAGDTLVGFNDGGNAGRLILGSHIINRAISDDGRYVFFSTAEALDPVHDTNGQIDAYEYDTTTEEAQLLSSGQSKDPSYFAEASADGTDAFFTTAEQLSGWDTDNAIDLYDARVNGGFPEPPAPPQACSGDACQPAPTELNDPTPASAGFTGPGSPAQRKARHHRHRRHSKAHRHKRHAQARQRHATSTRRHG